MITSWRSELPQWLPLLAMFVTAGLAWPFVPESIPVHWNIRGEVNRYGGRVEGLLLLPVVATLLYGLLLVVPKIDPGRANYASFRSAYLAIRISILVMMAFLYFCFVLTTLGFPVDIGIAVPLAVSVLFVILGNLMGKIRPNWFVGIRTPWTLSSHRSWNHTHPLGGRLFVVMGLAIGMCGLIRSPWMVGLAIAIGVISTVWMVIYSWLVWRNDSERLSPSSISPGGDCIDS